MAAVLASLVVLALSAAEADAQCNGKCATLKNDLGQVIGYGCGTVEGTNARCLASNTWCRVEPCFMTLLTDDRGVVLASIQQCDDTGKALPVRLAEKSERKRGGIFVPVEPRTTAAASDHEQPTPVAGG